MKFCFLPTIVSLLALVSQASAETPMADCIPGPALMYAGWAGENPAFNDSMMAKILADTEIVRALRPIIAEKFWRLGAGKDMSPPSIPLGLISIGWKYPTAVAMTDLKMIKNRLTPVGVMLIDPGQERAVFDKELTAMLEAMPSVELEPKLDKNGLRRFKERGTRTGAYGYLGHTFFICSDLEVAQQILALTGSNNLASNKKFIECLRVVSGKNEQLAFYINYTSLIARTEEMLAEQGEKGTKKLKKFKEAIGKQNLGRMTAIAGTIRVVDRGMYTYTRFFTAAPHTDVWALFSGANIIDADLASVPADAYYLAVAKLPSSVVLEELERGEKVSPNYSLGKKLTELGEDYGVSMKKDVLAHLGDTWVLSSAASQGGFLTGTFLSVTVNNPKKLNSALEKVKAKFPPFPPDEKAEKEEGWGSLFSRGEKYVKTITKGQVEISHLAWRDSFLMPIASACAIHGGKLYVTFWPQVISATIENAGKDPITNSPRFIQARAKLSDKACIMGYLDLPQVFRQAYPLLLAASTMKINSADSIGEAPEFLPALPDLEKYLQPQISAISTDETGVVFEEYGSLPMAGIGTMPLGSPLGAAIMAPMMVEGWSPMSIFAASGDANRAVSMTRLKGIDTAAYLYSNVHNGEPAPSLEKLVEEDYIPVDLLVSPVSGRGELDTDENGIPTEPGDYVYIPLPISDDVPSTLIRAYEKPENYEHSQWGEGTIAVSANHGVEWMDIEAFREALERTKKWLAEHKKK